MKLSLAWVFDHIEADWKTIDVPNLVAQFNRVVAEIEGYEKITIDVDSLSLAQVTDHTAQTCSLTSTEWNQTISLPARKGVSAHAIYLIKRDGNTVRWATAQDVGGGKEMLLPALDVDATALQGSWKHSFEHHDYIIELDNKSVTNRPDMWGHRGFAREIAAMLKVPLKPQTSLLADIKVLNYDQSAPATAANPIAVTNQAPTIAKRFAGMYCSDVSVKPSIMWMMHRLVRVDAKPIDSVVDATNYVMFDWGQPMHAFDAQAIAGNELTVRMAKNKESLTLLDGETIALTSNDMVVADAQKPLGLAGVMGGKESGITASTTAMLVESACFDATTIRLTSARYKKRSEASARFEKTLDPNNNVPALQRFVRLAHDANIMSSQALEIFSLGPTVKPLLITIEHSFIERLLGVTIAPEFVLETMARLEIEATVDNGVYTMHVPSFRSTKDIKIKEDIVEEIGRFYGYTTIAPTLPRLPLRPVDLGWLYRQRLIKHCMAYALQMRELSSYAFFDEEFLQQIAWNPGATLEVKSPVSENWKRLITTLIPGLLKAVVSNSSEYEQLRFFEQGRVWLVNADSKTEKKMFAGIFFDKKGIDFYAGKAYLETVFQACTMNVSWEKVDTPDYPWYAPYQTARLREGDTIIGIAGVVHQSFLNGLCPGQAFIFELDADYLLHHKYPLHRYEPGSKYPEMVRDISILIARSITAHTIMQAIERVNAKIVAVSLQDFFEKDEWPDKRAMTFRFTLSDKERTMTKEEADAVWDSVAHELTAMGATIR